jgi:RimJ/RimL family protein N-acetyltransferase
MKEALIPSPQLRELRESDLPLLLAWSRNPDIWEHMPTSRKGERLTWEKHHAWYRNRSTFDRVDCMILYQDRPVGVVHATGIRSLPENYVEVGLYIGETGLWGQGIGAEALEIFISLLRVHGIHRLEAQIHPDNVRSIRLFTKAGFKRTEIGGRSEQDVYRYEPQDKGCRPPGKLSRP